MVAANRMFTLRRIALYWNRAPPTGVFGVDYNFLVDVDEAGIWFSKSKRSHGWCFVGHKASIVQQHYSGGVKLNLILAVTRHGYVVYWVTPMNTNAEVRS